MSFLRRARRLTTAALAARFSSPSSSLSRSIFSTSSPVVNPAFSAVAPTAPPNVTDVGGEEEEEEEVMGYSIPAAASVVLPDTPVLLQPRVVVYDGVCHLCHSGVKWVIRVDKHRKIKFCCLQSKAAEPYMKLCGLDREDVSRRFLFVEGPGQYHQASTAALRVVSYLPLPHSALSGLLIIPAPLRDMVYDYIARNRYSWFGKDDECLVLREQDLLDRFIDRDELLEKSRTAL